MLFSSEGALLQPRDPRRRPARGGLREGYPAAGRGQCGSGERHNIQRHAGKGWHSTHGDPRTPRGASAKAAYCRLDTAAPRLNLYPQHHPLAQPPGALSPRGMMGHLGVPELASAPSRPDRIRARRGRQACPRRQLQRKRR